VKIKLQLGNVRGGLHHEEGSTKTWARSGGARTRSWTLDRQQHPHHTRVRSSPTSRCDRTVPLLPGLEKVAERLPSGPWGERSTGTPDRSSASQGVDYFTVHAACAGRMCDDRATQDRLVSRGSSIMAAGAWTPHQERLTRHFEGTLRTAQSVRRLLLLGERPASRLTPRTPTTQAAVRRHADPAKTPPRSPGDTTPG